jgi:xanthine dehydrogenase accessory factor
MPRFYECLPLVLASGEPFAMGIISGIKGSSPQKQGAKAIFFADGRIKGTMGGGCLEAEIQERARRALVTGKASQFELVLDHDFGWDDGLICGGKVIGLILPKAGEARELWLKLAEAKETVGWGVREDFSIARMEGGEMEDGEWLYRETCAPPCALWIAGAGHVAQAVAPLAQQLDFAVTVFDDRAALASRQYFPAGINLRVDYWEKLLEERLPERPTFGLIVTRGHQHDALVLRHWIQKPFAFLGMIGSRRKARIIFEQFKAEGLATAEQLAQVACPVGLEIESQTVPEIAVSIMAQYVQRRAAVMSNVQGPMTKEEPITKLQEKCGLER